MHVFSFNLFISNWSIILLSQLKSEEAALISKLQEIEEEREKIAEDTQQQKKELEKLEVEEERYLC